MTDEHLLMIGKDYIDDTYGVGCSCGWEGRVRLTEAEAVDEWENHCDVVFMEATSG